MNPDLPHYDSPEALLNHLVPDRPFRGPHPRFAARESGRDPMKICRTEPGRYYGVGSRHTYLITRDGEGGWNLSVTRAITVAGVKITDSNARPDYGYARTLATVKAIAVAHHALGDDYCEVDHGHRSRLLEAITSVYRKEEWTS